MNQTLIVQINKTGAITPEMLRLIKQYVWETVTHITTDGGPVVTITVPIVQGLK